MWQRSGRTGWCMVGSSVSGLRTLRAHLVGNKPGGTDVSSRPGRRDFSLSGLEISRSFRFEKISLMMPPDLFWFTAHLGVSSTDGETSVRAGGL